MSTKIEKPEEQVIHIQNESPKELNNGIFKNQVIYVEVYNSTLDQSEHFKEILEAEGAKVILN
jgi:hypothetical protein